MNYYLSQGMIPMQPACAPQQMISACNAFYRFVFQVSQNKLYQPTVSEREFSTVMNIPRSPHLHDFGADDSVKGWLVNYAQAHLHDPGKDHIILSDFSQKIVYNSYENDFKQALRFISQRNMTITICRPYYTSCDADAQCLL